MKKAYWKAKHGNVYVPVHHSARVKNGQTYHTYRVIEHKAGKRHFHSFADPEEAKAKAQAVADAIADGVQETQSWSTQRRLRMFEAQILILDAGFTSNDFPGACRFLRDACKIAGGPEQVIAACQPWAANNATRKFSPKPVADAVADFLARRGAKVSPGKYRADAGRLNRLAKEFAGKCLHEIGSTDLSDMLDRAAWMASTRKAVLKIFSLSYDDCIQPGLAAVNPASSKAIKRGQERGSEIGIFTPVEAKAILSGIEDDLRPAVALWMFSGVRKEEIDRLTWQEIHAALQSGSLYMPASKTKTGTDRSVPIETDLRKWLTAFAKPSGRVLPPQWQGDNLSKLTVHLSEASGTTWKDNGPRHSFASYSPARGDAPASVSAATGNSLAMSQKHYWARSKNPTKEVAGQWFAIVPDDCASEGRPAVSVKASTLVLE